MVGLWVYGVKMDCCNLANTCIVSFVASLVSLLGVVVLYLKQKIKESNDGFPPFVQPPSV